MIPIEDLQLWVGRRATFQIQIKNTTIHVTATITDANINSKAKRVFIPFDDIGSGIDVHIDSIDWIMAALFYLNLVESEGFVI